MAKSFKKALSLLLSLMMLTGMCSVGAVTAGAEDADYTILLGQTVNVEIGEGESVWVEFTPSITTRYTFFSSADTDTYGYLFKGDRQLTFDDDGGSGNNFSITYKLTAGETYRYKVRFYNSGASGSFNVTLVDTDHVDSDFDGKCEACGLVFRIMLASDVPATVTLSPGDNKTLAFRCEKDGEYIFTYGSYTGNGWDNESIYDSKDNEIGYWYDYLTLKAGEIYTTDFYSYGSDEVTVTNVMVRHRHTDDNGDGKCDLCSAGFTDTIAFGEKKTVTIPANDMRELSYTCQETGFYRFVYDTDTNGYDESMVIDPDGDYVGEMYDDIYFVSGKTYRLRRRR